MPTSRKALSVLVAVVLGFATLLSPLPAASLDAATFIEKTYRWAQAEEREYGVPASVAMAQSMLESGMGESGLTRNANNWFGIKCSSATSPHQTGCYSISTTEYDANGNPYTTVAKFRSYDNPEKSFVDHGYFLSRLSRYAKAFDFTDNPDRFIVEVHLGGYATDPQYANKVINLMTRYNLYQYNLAEAASGTSELVIRPQTRVNVGSMAYVTGLLSPGGGERPVWTQAWTANGWSTSQKVTSGARGQFSIPLTYGKDTVGVTRFRVQAQSVTGVVTTSEFGVDRLGSLRVEPVEDVYVDGGAQLIGTATGYGGRSVKSQVLVSGSWRDHSTATVAADGTFTLPLTYGQSTVGTRTFRAVLTTAGGATLYSGRATATWRVPVTVTAHTAGTKAVGHATSTWGTATGAPNAEVWTEVSLGGAWSRSQTRTTDQQGNFVIPLTYGQDARGTLTWRVGVRSPLGVYHSDPFMLSRVPAPEVTAQSAGEKPVGQDTYTWGVASGAPSADVWTEVKLDGGWARSQRSTTDASGRFVIPLTYGSRDVGEHAWRVGVGTSFGVFHSNEFSLQRTVAPVRVTAHSAGVKGVGQTTYTWGVATGAQLAEVWTEVSIGGSWSRSQVRVTEADGSFVIPLTYGSNGSGTHAWRVGVRTSDGAFYSNEFALTRVSG